MSTIAIGHVTTAVLIQPIPVRIIGLSHEDNSNDPMLRITLCESLSDTEAFAEDISNRSGYVCTQDGSASIAYNTGYTTFSLRIHI